MFEPNHNYYRERWAGFKIPSNVLKILGECREFHFIKFDFIYIMLRILENFPAGYSPKTILQAKVHVMSSKSTCAWAKIRDGNGQVCAGTENGMYDSCDVSPGSIIPKRKSIRTVD